MKGGASPPEPFLVAERMPGATSLSDHCVLTREFWHLPDFPLDIHRLTITVTIMVTVSIQEMRFDFAKVKSGLERGEEFMLTYRNRPLAKLLPVGERVSATRDPALSFADQPENLPPMSNEEIDRAIYG